MKKGKLLLLTLASASLCLALTACGHTHEYGDWSVETEPTETAEGEARRYCAADNEYETFTLPALSNTEFWQKSETPATHDTDGSTVYTSEYGTVTVVLPKEGHTYDGSAWTVTTKPTETAEGEARRECTAEDGGYETMPLPKLSDNAWEVETVTELSHTQNGVTKYTLKADTSVFFEVTVEKLAEHTFGSWTVTTKPTETAEGEARRECTANDGGYETKNLPALSESDWTVETVSALSHDEDGVTKYTLKADASVFFEVTVEKLTAHVYGSWTIEKEPTMTETGTAVKTCIAGDDTQRVDVPALSDEVWTKTGETAATHVTDGSAVYTSEYGTVTVVLPKGDHTYDGAEWTVTTTPTETAAGEARRACTANDGGYETKNLPALSDTEFWTKTETAPTETATGEIRYTNEENGITVKFDTVLIYTSENGVSTARTIVAGKAFSTGLPAYTVDEENRLQFKGWFIDAAFTTALDTNGLVVVRDNGYTIYGQWAALPVYYGTYSGNQLLSGSSIANNAATLTINAEGVITGTVHRNNADYTISGNVAAYDEAKGIITCLTDGATFYLWIEQESGMIAMASEWEDAKTIGTYPYLFTRDGSTLNGTVYFSFYDGEAAYQPYTYFVSYGDDGEYALIYTDKLYVGVTAVNYLGEAVALSGATASTTLIFKSGEDVIVAFGKSGTTYVALDAYYGVYTVAGETEAIKFDGLGNFVYGEKTGIYSAAAEYLELYVRTAHVETETDEDDNTTETVTYTNTEYYRATLADGACTLVKPMAQITYQTEHGTASNEEANVNIAFTLPVLTEENYVFLGWYFDEAYENAVGKVYTFTTDGEVTLYAKWADHVVLTVVFNDGETANAIYDDIAIGGTKTVDTPYYAKHKFEGWYTTATFDEGTEWISGDTAIDTDTTIYAKWSDAPAYYNTYRNMQVYGTEANGKTSSLYSYSNVILEVDADGHASGTAYPFRGDVTIAYVDETTGYLTVTVSTSVYYGYIEKESGIIIMTYSAGTTFGQVWILSPFSSLVNADVSSSYWNSGNTRAIQYTYEGTTYSFFVYNNSVYFNVSFRDIDGNAVAGANCYQASSLYIYAEDGEEIARFAYDGTTMVALDGYEGTYTGTFEGESATLFFNGINTVTFDDVNGTYEKADGENCFGVYLDGSYYEVTLDRAAYTFTEVKPMVTVTFETEHGTAVAAQTVNKNIEIALPEPSDDAYVFRGWYVAGDGAQALVNQSYLPVADVTLVAKWDVKVTLTVIYNKDGWQTVTASYGENDAVDLSVYEPTFTAGQVFEGWYLDGNCTQAAELTTITENTTIYCNWKDAVAQYGSYAGGEIWGGTSYGGTSSGGSTGTMTVSATGELSTKSGYSITDYDEETGIFYVSNGSTKYFGYFDAANGVLIYSWSSNKEYLGNDYYVYFQGAKSATASSASSYWNSGYNRVATYTVSGGKWGDETETQVTIYIVSSGTAASVKLYVGVTLETTDTSAALTAYNAYSRTDLSIYDSERKLISLFVKKGTSGLVELDAYRGTYEKDGETIVLDGVGGIVYGDKSGTYASAEEDADYGFDVYLQNNTEYYHLTLDGSSFVLAMPTVTLTYSSAYSQPAAAQVNLNVPFALTALSNTETHVFRGWYLEEDFSGTAVTSVTLTQATTVYAKWDAYVTVALHYAKDGVDDITYASDYAVGDTVTLVDPGLVNGQVVEGWYTTATFEEGTEWTSSSVLTAGIDLYAKWMNAHAMYGTYVGFNLYGSNSGKTITSFDKKFSVDAYGTVTGNRMNGDITDYDESTGVFRYGSDGKYGFYNAESGIVAEPFANATTSGLGTDMNIYFAKEVTSVAASSNLTSGSWTSILLVTYKDNSTELIAIYDNKVYSGISWEATNASNEAITDVTKVTSSATVTIKTSSGETLYTNAS